MKSEKAWVVFDADNTLWKTETLYDKAREAFARFVVDTYHRARPNMPKDEDIDEGLVSCAQRIRDKALSKTYGYSACRYARSFEDTLLFFMPDSQHADVIHARKMALDVFEKEAEPMDGVEAAVNALQKDYRLAIITAGERWVQERRLRHFHLQNKFSETLIVETKTEEVFREFCERQGADPTSSWVVGDSIRSDVKPALDAGMNAVLLEAPNWDYEYLVEERPFKKIKTMADLPEVILPHSAK